MSGVEIMDRDDIDLRTLLEQEFDLSDQSIETFLEKLRTSYQLQGLIFSAHHIQGAVRQRGQYPRFAAGVTRKRAAGCPRYVA
jgi:hypothetical protein